MFFIFNCKNEVIGNPKGYKTHKGAERQCNSKTSIRNKIYTDFYLYKLEKPENNHIYSIKFRDKTIN